MRHPSILVPLLTMALLATASAQPASPWPEPAMAVGQSAPRWRSFVPKGMELVGQPVTLPADYSPNPVQALLLRQGERYALLIGTTTGEGRFEAWNWATFMNCAICLDDGTANAVVRISGRGKVLNVTTEASSVKERASWAYTWRLRERQKDGMLELIGMDALTGIEGRQATRESINHLSGETVTEVGTLRAGKLANVKQTQRGKLAEITRPTPDQIQTAF